MRIWFDTEFYENGETIRLISIGAVREDGAEYYAETFNSRELAHASEWLSANVAPHLTVAFPSERKSRADIARDLIAFAGPSPEFWAYYADYDWVVLCQLFGRMIDLPKGWPMWCRDLKQLASYHGVTLPVQEGVEHHAMADAKWARDATLWCESYVREPAS